MIEAFFFPLRRLHQSQLLRLRQANAEQVQGITDQSPADIGKAIVCFQYVERIKSELIIAAKLLEYIVELKGDEQSGANKLFRWYLDALLGELNLAHNIVGRQDFLQAGEKVTAAIEKARAGLFEEAIRLVSEAISAVASSGQWSLQVLKDCRLL